MEMKERVKDGMISWGRGVVFSPGSTSGVNNTLYFYLPLQTSSSSPECRRISICIILLCLYFLTRKPITIPFFMAYKILNLFYFISEIK